MVKRGCIRLFYKRLCNKGTLTGLQDFWGGSMSRFIIEFGDRLDGHF